MAKLTPGAVEAIVVCFVLAFLAVLIFLAFLLITRARRNFLQKGGSDAEISDTEEIVEVGSIQRPGFAVAGRVENILLRPDAPDRRIHHLGVSRHNRYPHGRLGPERAREYSPQGTGGEVSIS